MSGWCQLNPASVRVTVGAVKSEVTALGGVVAMLVSPVALRRGGLPRLTRTETTSDGERVLFTAPDPRFAAQMRALTAR